MKGGGEGGRGGRDKGGRGSHYLKNIILGGGGEGGPWLKHDGKDKYC